MEVGAANGLAARALVAGLAANGVRHACISPGSRSTPLTVAFAEQGAIRSWLHLDERSSAFFALGLARATGEPVAVVCTSGTAAANFLPAAVEANLSRVSLILLTADRPAMLRDRGAAQTMDQVGLFGSQVRWALDLPLPSGLPADALRFGMFARRAVQAACSPVPGPVHLNVPFDEPLLASPGNHPAATTVPGGAAAPPVAMPVGAELDAAGEALANAKRPIIVAGPETGGLPAEAVTGLAAVIGAPVLADALSGLRTGPHDLRQVCDSFDAVMRDGRSTTLQPDAVVQFGGPPTSKALNALLARLRGSPYVLSDLPGGFRDANNAASHLVFGDARLVAEGLAARLAGLQTERGWLDGWLRADGSARKAMQSGAVQFAEPFEGRIFSELQAVLPAGGAVIAGNSMPVRDLDSFLAKDAKPLRLMSNRGANGIDGVTSSALGAAAADRGPVVLVIGDVSFYHDMNGLWAAKRHGLDLTIVLVNNGGSGIFHYLPQVAHAGLFEEWFGTPTGLDFRHAADLYGAAYTDVRTWAEFRDAMGDGTGKGLRILELRTDRAANAVMHRQLWAAAGEAAFTPKAAFA